MIDPVADSAKTKRHTKHGTGRRVLFVEVDRWTGGQVYIVADNTWIELYFTG